MPRRLPGAARRAGTLTPVAAGTGDRAGGGVLGDRERGARLRRGHEAVALSAVRRDHDVGQVAGRNLLIGDQLGVVALGVVLRVRVTRLDLRDPVARVSYRLSLLGALPISEERRQGDRG